MRYSFILRRVATFPTLESVHQRSRIIKTFCEKIKSAMSAIQQQYRGGRVHGDGLTRFTKALLNDAFLYGIPVALI